MLIRRCKLIPLVMNILSAAESDEPWFDLVTSWSSLSPIVSCTNTYIYENKFSWWTLHKHEGAESRVYLCNFSLCGITNTLTSLVSVVWNSFFLFFFVSFFLAYLNGTSMESMIHKGIFCSPLETLLFQINVPVLNCLEQFFHSTAKHKYITIIKVDFILILILMTNKNNNKIEAHNYFHILIKYM